MFDILSVLMFCWLSYHVLKLSFKVAWGAAKIIAVILFVFALPLLLVCLLYVGGVFLVLPLALTALAWKVLLKQP